MIFCQKQSINPITGKFREHHGRNPRKMVAYALTYETRHMWSRVKWKRAKNRTLRTHRIGR